MGVYHIKSLKWTKHEPTNPNGETVWWGPNNNGYTRDITEAGIYTEEQIQDHLKYYGTNTTEVIPIDASVWPEERIKFYKIVRSNDVLQIKKWERELEQLQERIETVKSLIESTKKYVKKTDMELAIQEKMKEDYVIRRSEK